MKFLLLPTTLLLATLPAHSAEFYVSDSKGDDTANGSASKPFKTIMAAANKAMPGDTITVHEGVYRERVDPPRGGESDAKRITYQAAKGEKVVITGAEPVKGWTREQGNTWKAVIPNTFFTDGINPFGDLITGDWFAPRGGRAFTGAVYLDGHWINAAGSLAEVQNPKGTAPQWYAQVPGSGSGEALLNLATLSIGGIKVPADKFSGKHGALRPAPCSEGGQCIGWISDGSWLKFEKIDFGKNADAITFRAAAFAEGGEVEIHLDSEKGELLGTTKVTKTGDWQKFQDFTAKIKSVSGEKTVVLVFRLPDSRQKEPKPNGTTLWARFPDKDPNQELVEVNVRQTVFYPSKNFINYITVRGFTLQQAAPNWAPPTVEQKAIIGPNWAKGWIIEDNLIQYSACCGVSLGKFNDDISYNGGPGYSDWNLTIDRALKNGWNKETVGSHIVRNNEIRDCDEIGIVGAFGCAYSIIERNHIHDIAVRGRMGGAELGGIKFHGPIDTLIRDNWIHHTYMGMHLDWMTQGTQITGNLMHNNDGRASGKVGFYEAAGGQDIFLEVNIGPCVVANNLLLSSQSVFNASHGGAFAHNLMRGISPTTDRWRPRKTPWLEAHGTKPVAQYDNRTGDDRFFNNLFAARSSLGFYNAKTPLPTLFEGNVFTKGTAASPLEKTPLLAGEFEPKPAVEIRNGEAWLRLATDAEWGKQKRPLVTGALLGKLAANDLPFENPDGSPVSIDTDYFGKKRNLSNPFPGPFETPVNGEVKVWPKP